MVMENAPIRLAVQMLSSHALPNRVSLLASLKYSRLSSFRTARDISQKRRSLFCETSVAARSEERRLYLQAMSRLEFKGE